ncbi:MAG: ABC transporter permease [Acidobacteria bacterium]|nr:ABC transporter permease [Acidobacteriota bacterium]
MLRKMWRNWIRRPKREADLDAEIRSWVDLRTDQFVKSGMKPDEARRAAVMEAGGIETVKDSVRDAHWGNGVASIARDLRFGLRLLRKNPGFTMAAIAVLALGAGANTAVFSIVHSVVLRSLPYGEPDRIVSIFEKRPKENNLRNVVSVPDFLDWRDQVQSFEGMSAVIHDVVTWQKPDGAEQLLRGMVSPEFFAVLGVKLAIGPGFAREEHIRAPYHAAVLTHGFWQRRLGGAHSVLGTSLNLNGKSATIAGVLPESFAYPVADVEFFSSLVIQNRESLDRGSHMLNVIARLRPSVSLAAAQTEMDAIALRLEQQHPAANKGHGANVVPLREVLLGEVRGTLLGLQAAVGFVLLIACANFANLLLARTAARERELSVRLAIGAGRRRVLRQLLCENGLIGLIGGAAAVALAYTAVPVLKSLVPADVPLLGLREAAVNVTVLSFCLVLSLVCGLVFGLAPAWRGASSGISAALKEGGGGVRGKRFRQTLITAQVALSVVLLSGAGLALRAFAALRAVDTGVRPDGVITMQAVFHGQRYAQPPAVIAATSEWLDAIARAPGVQAVGLTSHLPLSGQDGRRGLAIEGVEPPDPSQPRRAHIRFVSPGYFQAIGMRLVEGRAFTGADRDGSAPVMLVNEAAARLHFPNGKAVGHRAKPGGSAGPWHEVIGVVANVRHWGLDVEARPEQYYSHLQQPAWLANVVIRTSGDPEEAVGAARRGLRNLDSSIALAQVRTMRELVSQAMVPERSLLVLLSLFAATALALTVLGVGATMAYLLSQRRKEIGMRLVLGASEPSLIRGVAAEAMVLVAIGLTAGAALAYILSEFGASKVLRSVRLDLPTLASVAGVLALVAWLANYLPARWMVRTISFTGLREE